MKGIINGFKWLINFFKTIFGLVNTIINTIISVFTYLITIVRLAFNTLYTLPGWVLAFGVITISISIIYFIMGRDTGKSDK